MATNKLANDHRLPEPGKIYTIPADTHADLDLQDDKEMIFYSRKSDNYISYFQRSRYKN